MMKVFADIPCQSGYPSATGSTLAAGGAASNIAGISTPITAIIFVFIV